MTPKRARNGFPRRTKPLRVCVSFLVAVLREGTVLQTEQGENHSYPTFPNNKFATIVLGHTSEGTRFKPVRPEYSQSFMHPWIEYQF